MIQYHITPNVARGYTKQAICPDDPAYVLLWQNDSRINADDPYEALKEVEKM
jgi:hypothetical protein